MIGAVAVFDTRSVKGVVTFADRKPGLYIEVTFTKLPKGKHGFHIHSAGDLRGDGCKLACDHYNKGPEKTHGGPPQHNQRQRHTGDLGNVEENVNYSFTLKNVTVDDILGRSMIVHEDEDNLGLGGEEDSLKTGHSGKRIACSVIGRSSNNI